MHCVQKDIENCALLGYYAASSGNFLLTFQDNLPVPSSGDIVHKMQHNSQVAVQIRGERLSCNELILRFLCLPQHTYVHMGSYKQKNLDEDSTPATFHHTSMYQLGYDIISYKQYPSEHNIISIKHKFW
jgi:hypothetical protein